MLWLVAAVTVSSVQFIRAKPLLLGRLGALVSLHGVPHLLGLHHFYTRISYVLVSLLHAHAPLVCSTRALHVPLPS